MVSNTSGTEGAIAVTSAPTGLTFNTGVTAQDAKLTVDGVPLTESSNTLSGVITGVTLNLWGTNSTAASLSVTSDTTTIASDISSFVTDYNTVISAINSQYTADASGNEGVLAGDTSLEQVQSQLLSMLSSQYTGDSTSTYTTLTSLGITMNNDGTLSVNSTTLETALSDNTSAVKDFFTNTSGGFATSMYTSLKTITNTSTGALTMDVNGLTESNTALKKDISDFEVRMVAMQSSLTAEYDEINVEMEQYPSSLSSVSTILSSLSTTS
jgi:flagellar hook-associated protein 2